MSFGKNGLLLVLSVLIVGRAGAPEPARDREADRRVIAGTIRDSIRWALTRDLALLESTMAHDDDLFLVWTHSRSAVSGWSRYVKLFDIWMDPRFEATVTEVRDLQIHISRSGDVAWYSATLEDLGEWDGRPVGARDIRWTGVLERRRGKWVIVQMHGSVAADSPAGPANQ